MKITTKGQVTIPQKLRERYGLLPESEVTFEAADNGVLIRLAANREAELDRRLSKATGSASVHLTTDEIMRITRGED
jgi:antitoxin PrlF